MEFGAVTRHLARVFGVLQRVQVSLSRQFGEEMLRKIPAQDLGSPLLIDVPECLARRSAVRGIPASSGTPSG